jgi:hypothetical protein
METIHGRPIEPMELVAGESRVRSGECMQLTDGRWLVYQRATDRLVLGKLDFGHDKQDPVVERCRKEISGADSLGWIYSGSMEALTLGAADHLAVDPVAAWFKHKAPQYRFDLWLY